MTIPYHSIVILDVGHGNSAVLHDGDRIVVIDAGPKSSLLEYLTQQNITEIDLVLISHADADHLGGLIALISSELFVIKKVRLNSDSQQGSKIWDTLLYSLNESSIDFRPVLTTANNDEFDKNNIQIEILGPSGYLAGKGPGSTDRNGNIIKTNSISSVVRILDKGKPRLILSGDLDMIGLHDLSHHNLDLSSPIMIFPHHGGQIGGNIRDFTQQFISRVNPNIVIFSIRRGDNPLPEIIQEIRGIINESRIICTELSINCCANLPEIEPEHLSSIFSSGRRNNRCCSGSIIIDLDNFLKSFQTTMTIETLLFGLLQLICV